MSADDASPETNKSSGKTWEEHWATGHTPWDAGDASPSLKGYIAEHPLDASASARPRALVPGCGSGYDVFSLANAGFSGVGLDLAESLRPHFEKLRAKAELSSAHANLVTGDFFSLTPEELGGGFDFIWDYTFYCAIDPEQRDAWKEQMHRLLNPGGTLAMLLFPVIPDAPADQGPPYPLDPEKVTAQLSSAFERVRLEAAAASHPGREGKEWFSLWRPRGS